jgi:cysteine synthase
VFKPLLLLLLLLRAFGFPAGAAVAAALKVARRIENKDKLVVTMLLSCAET